MFNQKGQAFSVFELMIAAIVAIAILFILLQILPDFFGPGNSPVDSIGNVLSTTPMGTVITQDFTIGPNEIVRSEYLEVGTGIDKCSIYFESGAFGSNQIITDVDTGRSDNCNFYFENFTNRSIQAKATVICESSAETLSERITDFSSRKPYDLDEGRPVQLWGSGDQFAGYSKVCVVVLERQ